VKLLLDENLSPRLVASLADVYSHLQHVHNCDLGSAGDTAIWDYAQANGYVIVSKDSDFAERSMLQRNPSKVIWIRVGNCSTSVIETMPRAAVDNIRIFIETDNETCLILTQSSPPTQTKTPSSAAP